MNLPIRSVLTTFRQTWSKSLHLTATNSRDKRDKRQGLVPKSDKVDGEHIAIDTVNTPSFELIDDKLMDKVIGNVKFKDIPRLHIICTKNNTKIALCRPNAPAITKTAGTEGFKNCRKGTTVAAQAVANRILSLITDYNVEQVRLVFDGLGPGRDAAYKVFEIAGVNVVSLSDRTEAIEPWIKRPRKVRRI